MKKLIGLLACVFITLALSTNAFAYLDPSTTTYLIQAVAGIVVAIGAVAGIYYHKAKKKINKTLNIDENAKKEVEDDVVIFDEGKE